VASTELLLQNVPVKMVIMKVVQETIVVVPNVNINVKPVVKTQINVVLVLMLTEIFKLIVIVMMDFMILIKTIQFVNNVILNVLLVIKLDVLLAVSTELLLQNVLVKMVIIVRQEKMIKNVNFVQKNVKPAQVILSV
jgi:hypothetical protein